MGINLQNWPYFTFILILLVLAGVGEYLHIVPSGTFSSLLLVAIGLIAPSPAIQLHSSSAAGGVGITVPTGIEVVKTNTPPVTPTNSINTGAPSVQNPTV